MSRIGGALAELFGNRERDFCLHYSSRVGLIRHEICDSILFGLVVGDSPHSARLSNEFIFAVLSIRLDCSASDFCSDPNRWRSGRATVKPLAIQSARKCLRFVNSLIGWRILSSLWLTRTPSERRPLIFVCGEAMLRHIRWPYSCSITSFAKRAS